MPPKARTNPPSETRSQSQIPTARRAAATNAEIACEAMVLIGISVLRVSCAPSMGPSGVGGSGNAAGGPGGGCYVVVRNELVRMSLPVEHSVVQSAAQGRSCGEIRAINEGGNSVAYPASSVRAGSSASRMVLSKGSRGNLETREFEVVLATGKFQTRCPITSAAWRPCLSIPPPGRICTSTFRQPCQGVA